MSIFAGAPLLVMSTVAGVGAMRWRGRLGFASLAASPYWLGYYGLMLLLEAPAVRSRMAPRP